MINADLLKINSASYTVGGAAFNNNMLDATCTDSSYFEQTTSYPIANMPPISEATTIIGYREVYKRNSGHFMIKVTEMYPVAGRTWFNFYNTGSWGGWITNVTSNNFHRTKTFFGEVSAYPEYYTIYAHGIAVFNKPEKTVDLHFSIIPTKVDGVTIPEKTYKFMSKEKFLSLLGISDWNFDYLNTSIKPCINTDDIKAYCGMTGLAISPASMIFARYYSETENAGGWEINSPLYEKLSGKQINIDIYGATYS